MDITILYETRCYADVSTHCPSGYRELIIPSLKNSNIKRGRDLGGMIVHHRGDLKNSISPVKRGETHICLQIKGVVLKSNQEICLCAVCMPPSDSL